MGNDKENTPKIFDSTTVIELVGISPVYLNTFMERKQYGIEASFSIGTGRGSRRIFSKEDVFAVALVWWLFESGLRSETIQFVLNQICHGRLHSSARDAARRVMEGHSEFLVIFRQPRKAKELKSKHPRQRVLLEKLDPVRHIEKADESVLIIPVGSFFSNLQQSMDSIQTKGGSSGNL
jgi:hypothetical protein